MASEEHADDCCPNYVPMNMAKSAHNYCIAENKRLLSENAFLKSEVERLKNNCEYLDQKLDEELEKNERLNDLILRGASIPDAKPVKE